MASFLRQPVPRAMVTSPATCTNLNVTARGDRPSKDGRQDDAVLSYALLDPSHLVTIYPRREPWRKPLLLRRQRTHEAAAVGAHRRRARGRSAPQMRMDHRMLLTSAWTLLGGAAASGARSRPLGNRWAAALAASDWIVAGSRDLAVDRRAADREQVRKISDRVTIVCSPPCASASTNVARMSKNILPIGIGEVIGVRHWPREPVKLGHHQRVAVAHRGQGLLQAVRTGRSPRTPAEFGDHTHERLS